MSPREWNEFIWFVSTVLYAYQMALSSVLIGPNTRKQKMNMIRELYNERSDEVLDHARMTCVAYLRS